MTKNKYSLVNDDLLNQEQYKDFLEHRHDQSILTILARKYNNIHICDGIKELYNSGPILYSRLTDQGPRPYTKPMNGEKYMLTNKHFLSKQNDNNIKLELEENPKNTNNYIKIGFDIGASFGTTINLFDDCDIIYAFEPNPALFAYLQTTKNKHKNRDKIFTYNYAISDTNGTALFNIMYHYGYSSLLDFDESGNLFKHCNKIDNGFDQVRCRINVQTKRLDSFIEENNIQNILLSK